MKIKLASWNIEGRLRVFTPTRRGMPEQIVREIERLDADVVVLPEAYAAELPKTPHIDAQLKRLGYTIIDTPYDDDLPSREDSLLKNLTLRVLTRMPAIHHVVRFGEGSAARSALKVTLTQGKDRLTIFAVHLDDRSEALRQSAVQDLLAEVRKTKGPVAIIGDYNAMSGTTRRAKLIHSRLARAVISALPHSFLSYYLKRATEMATGSVLASFQAAGLHDADPHHRPTTTPKIRGATWLPSIRLLDLDHLYVSPDVQVSNFRIMPRDGGSDHRAISAELTTK